MEFYCVVYYNDKSDYIVSIVRSKSAILAERKAKEDVKLWEGFSVWSVNWLDKTKIEAGKIVFCAAAQKELKEKNDNRTWRHYPNRNRWGGTTGNPKRDPCSIHARWATDLSRCYIEFLA